MTCTTKGQRSRSPKFKVKSTFLSYCNGYWPYWHQTKAIRFVWMTCTTKGHGQSSRSFKVNQGHGQIDLFGHISMNIHRIDSKQKPLVCVNDLHHWSQGQRSRSSKVTQGQGQIDLFGHISMNIDRIDSKQKPLGLYEWPAPPKVKVKGQCHPRSPKVEAKLTFLVIFLSTPNKSH